MKQDIFSRWMGPSHFRPFITTWGKYFLFMFFIDWKVPCNLRPALGGIGGVKGHNMKGNTLPGSPALWGLPNCQLIPAAAGLIFQ